MEKTLKKKIVLVGIIKNKRDLGILLNENWYRMPIQYMPKRLFKYLAFYQPALFGQEGKCIRYYARVLKRQTFLRKDLLPEELSHPRAKQPYARIRVGGIIRLPRPIRNLFSHRVCFGFTTLGHLLESKNILELYNVFPAEKVVGRNLKLVGIRAVSQHRVFCSGKRYCLDFAVFCKQGKIAIECDNIRAHSSSRQLEKDIAKDACLRRHGWVVIRLVESEIVSNLKGCIQKVQMVIRKLGGVA